MFLIVAGGDQPGTDLIRDLASRAEMIIAADRGARYCLENGILPDLVVGDMDSIDDESIRRLAEAGVETIRYSPEKDLTDTEIAMEEAIARGAGSIELIGVTGDRLDHVLANIQLLRRALGLGVEAQIISGTQKMFLLDSSHSIHGSRGRTISFLPLTEKVEGITLEGFRYGLKDAAMEIGKPYGISNVVECDDAHISLRKGILLAVLSTS